MWDQRPNGAGCIEYWVWLFPVHMSTLRSHFKRAAEAQILIAQARESKIGYWQLNRWYWKLSLCLGPPPVIFFAQVMGSPQAISPSTE